MVWLAWITAAVAADLTFVVVGDTQGSGTGEGVNTEVLPQLVEDMNVHAPDVALFPGGLVSGSEILADHVTQWEAFRTLADGLAGEQMLLPGTSDLVPGDGAIEAWRETFSSLPVGDSPEGEEGISYYRDFGAVRLIALASDQAVENQYKVSDGGLEWLDRVLTESESFDHVFVMTHHPISFSDYPPESVVEGGGQGHTGDPFWQTLLRHDVTALFAAHWNRYQVSQLGNGGSTWEAVVGTGGGAQNFSEVRAYQEHVGFLLVEVTGEEVRSTFYGDSDEDGRYDNPLHSVVLASAEVPETGLVARYTFDGAEIVDSAPDETAFGIPGRTLNMAEFIEDGAVGTAVQMQGDDDAVEVSALDDYRLGLLGDLSISMWVRMPGLNTGSRDNVLIAYASEDLYSEDEQSNYAYFVNILSDGRVQMSWEYENGKDVSVVSSAAASVLDGGWHHIGVVRDSTRKRVDFYADGEPLGVSGTYVRAPTGASRGMLYLGSDIAGSNDSGSGSGEWTWSDGSEVSFTAWAVGEPNDWGGNQDCGVMRWGGSVEEDWDDLACSELRSFICQGEALSEPVEDTGALDVAEVECSEEEYEGLVTLFCTTNLTWLGAQNECRDRGLDLVSIHSAEEQAWLYEQVESRSSSGAWYIGLRERESVGAVDEVCIYNEMLDASEMERLGAQEDCVTVLEPLPPEPEDTGDLDTGSEDSGMTETDGSPPIEGDSGSELDSADPASVGAKAGCACTSTAHRRAWSWLGLLGVLIATRRRRSDAT